MGLEAIPREILVAIAVLATLYAVVTAAHGFIARARRRLRFERAADGERAAAAILEDYGYTVEGAQVTTTYPIEVDGAEAANRVGVDSVIAGRKYNELGLDIDCRPQFLPFWQEAGLAALATAGAVILIDEIDGEETVSPVEP